MNQYLSPTHNYESANFEYEDRHSLLSLPLTLGYETVHLMPCLPLAQTPPHTLPLPSQSSHTFHGHCRPNCCLHCIFTPATSPQHSFRYLCCPHHMFLRDGHPNHPTPHHTDQLQFSHVPNYTIIPLPPPPPPPQPHSIQRPHPFIPPAPPPPS